MDLTGHLSNPPGALCQLADQAIGGPLSQAPKEGHAAGQVPRPKPRTARPLKPADVDAVVGGYRSDKTMKELAAQFGIDRRTVSTYLRRAGIPVRRGGLDQEQTVEAARLYEAGWSSRRLAERFDVSADSVLKARRVVGWAMSSSPNTDLVTDALLMAFQRRRPDRRVVHHSDRGAVYTSLAFSHRLAECGLTQSFGSTGDAYDNAAIEAFWATLKRELAWIHHRTTWNSRAELRAALFDYIETFYNPERIQHRLDHHSPTTYEKLTAIA